MQDKYLEEDLQEIASSALLGDEFFGKTVFVTGATGLVGSMVVKALLTMNTTKNANISVLAFVRDVEKANRFYAEFDTKNLIFVIGDLNARVDASTTTLSNGKSLDDYKIDYIVHGASPTASKYFVTYPVETIMTAIGGTKNVLDLAKDKNVSGMVYMSSMEAFGITDPALTDVREDDLGYIDIHNVRSSYSEGKRTCELLCSSYASEYNVPVRIARLSQTFGAGVDYSENRVFAQFAKSYINKTDIVLHTEGKSVGNYCYTKDTVIAILLLLCKGANGEAYTISNPKANSKICDMAKMVAEDIAGGEIKLVFDIPEDAKTFGYAPDVNMRLNSDKLQALGWTPTVDLPEMYERLIYSLKLTKPADAE